PHRSIRPQLVVAQCHGLRVRRSRLGHGSRQRGDHQRPQRHPQGLLRCGGVRRCGGRGAPGSPVMPRPREDRGEDRQRRLRHGRRLAENDAFLRGSSGGSVPLKWRQVPFDDVRVAVTGPPLPAISFGYYGWWGAFSVSKFVSTVPRSFALICCSCWQACSRFCRVVEPDSTTSKIASTFGASVTASATLSTEATSMMITSL